MAQKSKILTHARFDPAHILARGLFRSIAKGERKRSKLDITYEFGASQSLRFCGHEPLGADDMRVLRAIVSLASVSGDDGRKMLLNSDTETDVGISLRRDLALHGDAVNKRSLVVKSSLSYIAKVAGYAKSGTSTALVKASIERMWAVSVIAKSGLISEGYRLLSRYSSDDTDIYIAINVRLAEAMIGGRYVYINLAEADQMKSDISTLLHAKLCAVIDSGKSLTFSIDRLLSYVFYDDSPPAPSALSNRKRVITRALSDLEHVGWTVTSKEGGQYTIKRPLKSKKAGDIGEQSGRYR